MTLRPLLTSEELSDRARRVLEGVVGIPATDNDQITVLQNGCEIFPTMFDARTEFMSPIL